MSTVYGFNTDIRYGDTVYHVQTEAYETDLIVQTAIFVHGRCIDKQESSYAQESAAPGFSEASVHQLLTRQHKFVVNCIREGKLGSLLSLGGAARMAGHMEAAVGYPLAEADTVPAVPQAEPVIPASPGPVLEKPSEEPSQDAGPVDDADILGVVFDQTWQQPTPAPAVVPEPEPEPEPITLPEVAGIPELKLDWLSSDSVFAGNSAKLRYRLTLGPRGVEGAKIVVRLEVGGVPSAYARTVTDCEGEAEVSFTLAPAAQNSEALSVTVQASHAGQSTARRFRLKP
jgi:hypothetical protein